MPVVQVTHVAKAFGETQAVSDVSFAVERGEIFGLLGPNGAGKTTTIRLMLDIFKPDRGTVSILDGPMTEEKKDRIGYMPEERGLYQDIQLERCLLYLASLKGIPPLEARKRLAAHLERFDLAAHKGKKVKELSKGMQQKAQIINTILHQPELVIIDEPFAALDPVNTQLVKDLIRELREAGTTILMSTHQMHQVEELCDRILLIDHGQDLLYGDLEEIRRGYSGHAVLVRAVRAAQGADTLAGELPPADRLRAWGVEAVSHPAPDRGRPAAAGPGRRPDVAKLTLAAGVTPQQVLEALIAHKVVVEKFEIATPTLEEIFIRVVGTPTPESFG